MILVVFALMLYSYVSLSCYGRSLYAVVFFFFQAEDGIRDAQESRGLGDVYKRQVCLLFFSLINWSMSRGPGAKDNSLIWALVAFSNSCLLYTSDAADDLLCVDLGGRRIIKTKRSL